MLHLYSALNCKKKHLHPPKIGCSVFASGCLFVYTSLRLNEACSEHGWVTGFVQSCNAYVGTDYGYTLSGSSNQEWETNMPLFIL